MATFRIVRSGAEGFETLDVPERKAVFARRYDDAIYVIVCCGARVHCREYVTHSRLIFSIARFRENGYGQICLTENVLGVGIQAAEFGMSTCGKNAVDGVLVGADEIAAACGSRRLGLDGGWFSGSASIASMRPKCRSSITPRLVSQRCGIQLLPEHAPWRPIPIHDRDKAVAVIPLQ